MITSTLLVVATLQGGAIQWPMGVVEAYKLLPANVRGNAVRKAEADDDGLVGRNQKGDWLVVGDQAGLGLLLSMSIADDDHDDAERALDGIEKTFAMMRSDGTFPMKLGNKERTPVGAQVSSNLFFLNLTVPGLAQAAQWDGKLKSRVDALKDSVRRAAHFAYDNRSELYKRDEVAANRMAINADAFTQAGKFLNDNQLIDAGKEFLSATLKMQGSDGAFQEINGGDSSYQAVSLFNLGQLYIASPSAQLKDSLQSGLKWYLDRFESDGKINPSGNTRTAKGNNDRRGVAKKGHNPPSVTRTLAVMAKLFPDSQAGATLKRFSSVAYDGEKIAPFQNYVKGGGN